MLIKSKLPEHPLDGLEKKKKKILKKLKKLDKHIQILDTDVHVTNNSGIGQNVMFEVMIISRDIDFKNITSSLYFDLTDYNSW